MLLEDKIVIIASGSKGIGKNIAKLFYQQGATLYLLARNVEVLAQTCFEIDIQKTGKIHFIKCDVGSFYSVKKAFAKLAEQNIIPDILINCTGFNLQQQVDANDFESWYKVLNINLTGSYLTSAFCLEPFKQKGQGTIINIGPIYCTAELNSMYNYIAKTGNIKLLTKACAINYELYNINCYGLAINADESDIDDNYYDNDLIDFIKEHGAVADDKISIATTTALYFATKNPKISKGKILSCAYIDSKL